MGFDVVKYIGAVTVLLTRYSHVMTLEMQYVAFTAGCGPDGLALQRTLLPALRSREVLIRNFATTVNRADTLQRRGLYPSPPGESAILGLDAAGIVEALAPDCTGSWKQGDRVMALLTGGGYAEYVAVPEDVLMAVSPGMPFTSAAAIPEVWLTAYQLLHVEGGLKRGDTVLIHAGGSGVGSAAVQLCLLAGCRPVITAGSQEKLDAARRLGAVAAFNYKTEDFSEKVLTFTEGRGVDLILDCVGASHYERNMKSIRIEGRWVLYGLLGGGTISGDIFSQMLRKRITITGTTLRARDLQYKKRVVDGFTRDVLPLFSKGASPAVKPLIDSVFPLAQAGEAHTRMEANLNTGKLVLQVRDEATGKSLHDEL
ncbi:quinone oxidoreductase PIG3-like [Mya arenaria]|uniref:quinone oxidoreductase PIG3-like n=1 Tax=Mya arenaria TaxID=6604 RepID=UPI0022E67514|nr:quinone oxidoreductase PIG3-like [Mya arenaria]